MSNRLSTCHETKQVSQIKALGHILLSTGNSHPLPDINSGLFFAAANVTWVAIKRHTREKKEEDPPRRENQRQSEEKSTPRRSGKVRRSQRAVRSGLSTGYRWRGRRTRGEINSAWPFLAAAPCWVSAEHAVLGKKRKKPPFPPARRHSMSSSDNRSIRVSEAFSVG